MPIRLLALALCIFAVAAVAGPAHAQSRVVRPTVVNQQHEQLKTDADKAYRAGDYVKTIELTGRVLGANPKDDVALYLRGSARVELGARTGEVQLVREGIADSREAISVSNRLKLDYYMPYLFGMSQLAALENKPTHAETARTVATQLLDMQKVTTAEKANIAYQRAQLNLQLQDNAAALADFAKAVEYDPKHLAAQLGRCDLLFRTGKPEDVEKAYAEAVERFPQEPLVFNNRGMFFQSFGRSDEAVADFNHAIELNPKFGPAYTNRAFSKLQSGQFTDALADLNKTVEIDPRQPSAYSLRGTAFLQTGDAKSALTDYEAALKLDPNSPQLRADVGFAQFFDGQYEPAVASFESAQEVDSHARFLNPWRAAALVAAGRKADAEQRFAETIAKSAANRDWFDQLVLLLLGKANDNDVLAAISGGDEQRADAQHCEAYYFIGEKLLLDDKRADAEPFFRQALDSKSVHLSAYRGAQFALGEFGAKPQ